MGDTVKINSTVYKIREIVPEDNTQLAGIIRHNFEIYHLAVPGTVYFDPELDYLSEYYLNNAKRGYYVLADDSGNVAGGIGFSEYPDKECCAELQKLYLADNVKGFGLGYVLIKFIEGKMLEAGFKNSYLETHENFKTAIHIYEKSGYERIARPKNVVHSTMTHFYLKSLVK